MVNTGQTLADFGLAEADIAAAARTSMPAHNLAGSIQDFLWQNASADMEVLPLPCHSSMMPVPGLFSAPQSSMPLASTVIALPARCRTPPGNERSTQRHPGSAKAGFLPLGDDFQALAHNSCFFEGVHLPHVKQEASRGGLHSDQDELTAVSMHNGADPARHAGPSRPSTQRVGSGRSATPEESSPPTKKRRTSRAAAAESKDAKDLKAPKDRSSQYRGVTKHRRSGRWEAHLWVKDFGRQVYLGGYEREDHAAEAYDVAALKCKGPRVKTNFPMSKYADLTECMHDISLEELIMAVRRQSQGFSRGTSTFRGVTHHPSGRWEARIGVPGSKHIYLGLYESEDQAAKAYDRSLVRLRGSNAATNFSISDYRADLADYYKMQQKVLQGDGSSGEELLKSGSEFERWIKLGLSSTEESQGITAEG
ncbi:g1195 [Coccomyxa viridis]|uniref:G1195 protein n=1 Tax=Coccomyxa viridis TaxID=1274662 RepID=A0ABP1FL92_9CHLO